MVNKKGLHFIALSCVMGLMGVGEQTEMRGCIKAEATSADKMPEFRVFFAGKETMSNREGFYSIPLEGSVKQYSMLICKNINSSV